MQLDHCREFSIVKHTHKHKKIYERSDKKIMIGTDANNIEKTWANTLKILSFCCHLLAYSEHLLKIVCFRRC